MFDVAQLAALTDDQLKALCADPRIDVGQQMLAAEELTDRAIKKAAKPHWSVRATFYLASLTLILLLVQLWWTSRYVPSAPITAPVAAAKGAAAKSAKPAKAPPSKSSSQKSKKRTQPRSKPAAQA